MNEVLGLATVRLRRALEASLREDPEVQELLDEVVARRLDPASAASAVLERGAVDASEAARAGEPSPGCGARGSQRRERGLPTLRVMRTPQRRTHPAPASDSPTFTAPGTPDHSRTPRRRGAPTPRANVARRPTTSGPHGAPSAGAHVAAEHQPRARRPASSAPSAHADPRRVPQPPRHQRAPRTAAPRRAARPGTRGRERGASERRDDHLRRADRQREERRVLGVALLGDEPARAARGASATAARRRGTRARATGAQRSSPASRSSQSADQPRHALGVVADRRRRPVTGSSATASGVKPP